MGIMSMGFYVNGLFLKNTWFEQTKNIYCPFNPSVYLVQFVSEDLWYKLILLEDVMSFAENMGQAQLKIWAPRFWL